MKINKPQVIKVATKLALFLAYCLLPLWPFVMGIVFSKYRFILNYKSTLRSLLIYFKALGEGPIDHYLLDVVSVKNTIPATIQGSCIKCGNCCLDKRCIFLEQTSKEEYICGIYTSPLRKFSNCNSFPLNARDIERYSCPSFTVSPVEQTQPLFNKEYEVSWMRSIS